MKLYGLYLSITAALLLLSSSTTVLAKAANPEIEAEIQHYIKIFRRDDFEVHRKAIDELMVTGITDARLYDIIASFLEDDLAILVKPWDRSYFTFERQQELAWYAKALGMSGNPKYRTLLQTIADGKNKKLSRHSETALEYLEQFSVGKPIVAEGLDKAPPGRLAEWRVRNMLRSGVPKMIQIGAKRLYRDFPGHPELTAIAHQVLIEKYRSAEDALLVDALAWLCKVLAVSGEIEYRETLKAVEENAPSAKLRRYGRSAKIDL